MKYLFKKIMPLTLASMLLATNVFASELTNTDNKSTTETTTTTDENIVDTTSFVVESNLYGVTEGTKVYTFDQAVSKAVSNSSSIKQIDSDMASNKFDLQQLEDTLNSTTLINNSYISNVARKTQLESTIAMKDELVRNAKDEVEKDVLSAVTNIEKTKDKILLQTENITLLEKTYEAALVKNESGIYSSTELSEAKTNLDNAKTELTTLETDLSTYKLELNTLMGVPQQEDNYIEISLTVEPLELSIDNYAPKCASDNTSIKQSKISQTAAKYQYDNYMAEGSEYYYEEKAEKLRSLQETARSISSRIESLESNIRSSYSNLKNIETNYATALASYETAVQDYAVAKIGYEYGYKSSQDLATAEKNIRSKYYDLRSIVLEYEAAEFTVLHPNLM